MTDLVEPNSDIAVWGALRRAVREAHQLGAKFRVVGAAIVIDGELPGDLSTPERRYIGVPQ